MSAFMPVLVFFPVFVAIAFMIANRRRGPQPPLTDSQRRTNVLVLVGSVGCAVLIAGAALAIVHHT